MPDVPHTATAPDIVVDGRRVFFVWTKPTIRPVRRSDGQVINRVSPPVIPYGALVEHRSPVSGRPCISWIPWVDTDPDAPRWTLLSLKPLSIAEPFTCSCCGLVGGIRDGKWLVGLA